MAPVYPYPYPAYPYGYGFGGDISGYGYPGTYGYPDTNTEWYCASEDAYFPDVTSCPEGWQSVASVD